MILGHSWLRVVGFGQGGFHADEVMTQILSQASSLQLSPASPIPAMSVIKL